MESAHDRLRRRGLPPWTLWAATPVVLAMGFVTGMAIATYAPNGETAASTAPQTETRAPATQNTAAPAPTATGQPDAAWRIVTLNGGKGTVPGLPGETDLENGNRPFVTAPAPIRFTGPATNLSDARKALASDYGTFAQGGVSFRVEYQAMRQDAATGTSLVGMISTADYPLWEKVLRDRPTDLRNWLEKATVRVRDAAGREGFHIAWAVVDVVDSRPAGYADKEITPLENGTYLVVRRLAATQDSSRTDISLRTPASLQEAAANQPVITNDSWATYGPAIRFDGSDIYRPIRTTGVNPKR